MATPSLPGDPVFVAFQATLAGRYSIDHEIGRGGMGVVYLAREVHLDRPVAIKLLPPDRARDPELRNRFVREARLAAKLSHPNIIPIHAVDEAGDFVYYVMAYVEGETLSQRVQSRGPLPNAEGIRVLRDVAFALGHAHAQGLIHRDVKPDNILIEAGTGRVLVTDFGIAELVADSTDSRVAGTPEFMSPEQALGRDVDGRSDLYSLGATAFYALTGRLPFEGGSPTEIVARQVTEPAPGLSSMGTPVSRKVAALIDRCLAKDPAQRPQSAQALAEQFAVAIEQRREIPIALRVFAKHQARMDGSGSMLAPIGALILTTTVGRALGAGAAITTFGALMVGLPAAYFVYVARGLLMRGFTHADVMPAFRAEAEIGREEHALDRWRGPSPHERYLIPASIVGLASTVAASVATIVLSDQRLGALRWMMGVLPAWTVMSGAVAAGAAVAKLHLVNRRADVDSEFWLKVWGGRIGKLAFSVAKRMLRGKRVATVMTHRATEMALGLAAENLFETLPRETRESLRDLPPILHRLQEDAQRLRSQYSDLQDALSAAPDGGTSDSYAAVRDTRDAVQRQLTEAVTALETIRLNLLRLHAGSVTVEGFTTHLHLAAEMSAEVERLLAAHEEIDAHLQFPREIASTPV